MIVVSGRTYGRQTGGNTRYVQELVEGLRGHGTEVEVAQAPRSSQIGWAAYEALQLQTRAKRRGASIAWYPADTGPVRRVRGLRTVLTLHGVGALHEPSVRNPVSGRIWLERARRAAKAADTIITCSQSSAADIETLAGARAARKTVVIPHGISPFWFDPPAASDTDDLNLPDGPFAFYYGNIEPRKNLPLAIEGLRKLRAEGLPIEFVVSGSPAWDSEPILEAMRNEPWIHYLGRLTDEQVRAVLHRTAIFMFPSRYEGFGLPVLEAAATGCAVVCSTRGSLAEVAGSACYTFDELDADAVAEACHRGLTEHTPERVSIAQEWARRFLWGASVDAHVALFNG